MITRLHTLPVNIYRTIRETKKINIPLADVPFRFPHTDADGEYYENLHEWVMINACNYSGDVCYDETVDAHEVIRLDDDEIAAIEQRPFQLPSRAFTLWARDLPDPNINCLMDCACPECGQRDAFDIIATAVFTLTDEGLSNERNIDYHENSPVYCACGWEGEFGELTR